MQIKLSCLVFYLYSYPDSYVLVFIYYFLIYFLIQLKLNLKFFLIWILKFNEFATLPFKINRVFKF